ncbi:hypothetical protein DFJ77DRAFT_107551 [Powellomyces hirtus]|nr:hypothetical protein DFJ77DRAFT_107551 [Powellomyces hirtus]
MSSSTNNSPTRSFSPASSSPIGILARTVATRARSVVNRRPKPNITIDALAAAEQDERERKTFEKELQAVAEYRKEFRWQELKNANANGGQVVAPAAEPTLSRSKSLPHKSSSAKPPPRPTPNPYHAPCHLKTLPTELLLTIFMRSGFHASLCLRRTCHQFHTLLSAPAAWSNYLHPAACDEVMESTVTVTTKVTMFDHLVFGTWEGVPPAKGGGKLKGEQVFFEHRAFDEDYAFLGGISVGVGNMGRTEISFFDHRDSLPCYRADLASRVSSGLLPSSISTTPTLAPPGHLPLPPIPTGTSILHTCAHCAHFDTQQILKSTCLLNSLPTTTTSSPFSTNPTPPTTASYIHTSANRRRTLHLVVLPYIGRLGYDSMRELPFVTRDRVVIAGKRLNAWEMRFWRNVVCR